MYTSDPSYVGDVVTFDRPRLPDIKDKHVVHLQCHIGTDTLSLARLGAASVVGLDISGESLNEARKLADLTATSGGDKLSYVQASVYDAPQVLGEGKFDVVFTGVGALNWIHSIKEWAVVVAKLLKPGGRFFIRELHPMLASINDSLADRLEVEHSYFERDEPLGIPWSGTYVDTDHEFKSTEIAEFNHGIGETVQALIDAGLRITSLEEHQSVPWEAIPGQMVADGNGKSDPSKHADRGLT